MKTNFLSPLLRDPRQPLAMVNERTGRPVATTLETAFDSASRRRGLLGRDSLPPGHALIIAPGTLIHTFFMRFPIDILFVARDGRVLKTRRSLPARRIAGALGAFAVVEMAGGELDQSQTVAGDRVVLVPPVVTGDQEIRGK